jgi:hypothetical protein
METQVIFTIFAGRKRYMEILIKYLYKLLDQELIDELHLWDFTWEIEDAEYIKTLAFNNKKIKLFPVFNKKSWQEYYDYYTPSRYPNPDTVIIKADDDIVYMDISKFKDFIDARRQNKNALFLSPFIVNNTLCTCILHEAGFIQNLDKTISMTSVDSGIFIHNEFLKDPELFIKNLQLFPEIVPMLLDIPWTFNINFIAILAKDLPILYNVEFKILDENQFNNYVKIYKRPITLDMHFTTVHMAFRHQRDDEKFGEAIFLEKYKKISNDQF